MLNSEAIQPYQKSNGAIAFPIGNLTQMEQVDDRWIKFKAGTVPIFIEFLSPKLFRFNMGHPHQSYHYAKTEAVLPFPHEDFNMEVSENEEHIQVNTDALLLQIHKNPFRISVRTSEGVLLTEDSPIDGLGWTEKKELFNVKTTNSDDRFYGFGEKTGFLNKKGTKQTMWNSDVFSPHNEETNALYQSIPFFIKTSADGTYGIFVDNASKVQFDLSEENVYSIQVEKGNLDYYFMYESSMKDIIRTYTQLTGRTPLPPKWALGYQQSRYSYQSESEVREIAQTLRARKIPCDVLYLDIHYMDDYRVFTWHPSRFQHAEKLISDLSEMGFQVVPIVDPGVKIDPDYPVYQQAIDKNYATTYYDGTIYKGPVWAGESIFPDFSQKAVQKWWGKEHQFYTQAGIKGIWNDMNEPSVFNAEKTMDGTAVHKYEGKIKTHQETHNLYGLNMSKATYEGLKELLNGERPFVVTRAGYAGIQRYATVWTGDNRSFWEHLALSIPMFLNMRMSGLSLVGADVGGFAHPSNGPLLARWTQLGAFTPFFRNHCVIDAPHQEPWSFGSDIEAIVKKYIELRYRLLPHYYTLVEESSRTGLPILRPLVLEYEHDPRTYNLSDQLLVGDSILLAPVIRPDTEYRAVYLPEGRWIDYWTHEVHEGKQDILKHAPLDIMPIYIKEGSIIAEGMLKQYVTEKEDSWLKFKIYPKPQGETTYHFYEDDGKTFSSNDGVRNEIDIHYQAETDTAALELKYKKKGYQTPLRRFEFTILTNRKPISIKEPSGKEIPFGYQNGRLSIIMADSKQDIKMKIIF